MAIHPYWYREFGLDRWCRQDVCLALWLPDRSHDLMYKVTDVCDPSDCPGEVTAVGGGPGGGGGCGAEAACHAAGV